MNYSYFVPALILSIFSNSSLVSANTSVSDPAAWQACGWGGGGFYFSTVFHPTKAGVIYMGSDVNGAYRTDDHGEHWKNINAGLANYGVYTLAVDPSNPDTVYAATEAGLCKSVDEGDHWNLLPLTGPSDLHITGEKGNTVSCIAVDPTDGKIVYAASPIGKVYKSIDAGQTWTAAYTSPGEKPGPIFSVTVSPKNPSMVLASTTGHGLVLSTDAGATWHELKTQQRASSAAFDPANSDTIYASFFTDGLWKSTDKGQNWSKLAVGTPTDFSATQVLVSPANSLDVYMVGAVATWGGGFYASHDGGATWKRSDRLTANTDANPTLDNLGGANTVLSGPSNLAICPSNPQELFMSVNWRPCLSTDSGATWTERDRGADITCVTDIRFSGDRTYVTAMDEGTFVSDNDGVGWRQLWPTHYMGALSGHNWRVQVASVKGVDRIITTASPWNSQYPPRVIISEDAGATFKVSTVGLPKYIVRENTMWGQGHPRALSVDPTDPNVVYLGIDGDPTSGQVGGGIFKSIDGGYKWTQLPSQPASRRMYYGLQVDPTDSKRIFWAACGDKGGLYRSEDGGASWSNIFPQGSWIFNVHVTSDGTVYCPSQNLWRSTDHGNTWTQVTHFSGGHTVVAIESDPNNPKTVWIGKNVWGANADGSVYRSVDAGTTWEDITGNLPHIGPEILRFNPATSELWAGWVGLYRIKQPSIKPASVTEATTAK